MIEFASRAPIEKGWSEDRKYCATDAAGTKYLLRVSPAARYENRKALYEILQRVAATGIPMNLPVDFWAGDEGVCMLYSWIGGEDLGEHALPLLPEAEQYALGFRAGEVLRQIHSIPAPENQEDWETRFNRETDMKIKKYHECGLRFEGDGHVLAYIERNRHLLKDRPQCFQHGDYHANNMMIEHGELRIIDFDRHGFGDPWEEFNRIVFSVQDSPHFARGQMRGYFAGEPPLEFFRLLALYIAHNTLSNITWAIPFGQSQLDFMMKLNSDILSWYDNMRNPVPNWYLK
ncbi:MAG: phosphotransferase [Oscillospiraceae bacterium]|jgi:serine/threonine-protein kinase|nr:phosphotransferase [Oscillospiraceae bacterium]